MDVLPDESEVNHMRQVFYFNPVNYDTCTQAQL